MGRVIDKGFSEPKKVVAMLPRSQTEWGVWWSIPTIYCADGYDEVTMFIRPFPYMETPTTRGMMLSIKELYHKQFMYCVTGWDGLVDKNGESLPCTEENKDWLFNNDAQIRQFVIDEIASMEEVRGVALKHSSTSQGGEQTSVP